MARLAKFSTDQIVETTAGLAARLGPAHVTIAGIAKALGAPTGSIYHRFTSRDELLGEAWLRAATAFQNAFCALLEGADPWEAGLAAALSVPSRARRRPEEARILLLHRREDFLADGWPADMKARAQALQQQVDAAFRAFARRLVGHADAATMRALRYALVDAPLAAVLPHLRAGEVPPASLDTLIAATYLAVVPLAETAHARRKAP